MDRDEMIKISLQLDPEAQKRIDKLSTENLKDFVASDAPNEDKKRYARRVLEKRLETENIAKERDDRHTEERRHQENLKVLIKNNWIALLALLLALLALFKD